MPEQDPGPRVRAALALQLAGARENCGLHEFDGMVADLSDTGVAAALDRLGHGEAPRDPHDRAHLEAVEADLRLHFATLGVHHSDPLAHIEALDVSCYDRPYAPEEQRREARRRHLGQWPQAVDVAVATLDRVTAPVAAALLPAAKGLAAAVDEPTALAAHARLVEHLERAARTGPPDCSVGAAELEARYGTAEACEVTTSQLAGLAERERTRLTDLLREACDRLAATGQAMTGTHGDVADTVRDLLADHPTTAEGVYAEARGWVRAAHEFSVARDLLADPGEELVVESAPPSRSWAMAMMAWSGPYEQDTPSCYWVTPPDPSWPAERQSEWLAVFSRTSLPAITVHEVTPGHYAHGRYLRRAATDVRRCLHSSAFTEGWAHDAEELLLEEGFAEDDSRYQAGVALEGLVRAVRLAVSVGLHTGALDVEAATDLFRRDALLPEAAARSEARRGTFDVTYGRYTWGKEAIRRTRADARERWGSGYTHRRFTDALLALGAPPLGLLGTALDQG